MTIEMKRIVLPILALCLGSSFATSDESLPLGIRFASPSRRYSVEVQKIDRTQHLLINDARNGRQAASIPIPTLLLYVHWSSSSKSVVTVEHLAHGSYGRVIYTNGDKWMNVEVHPPGGEMKNYTVINLEMSDDRVHYRFAVRRLKSNGMPLDYSFYDADINLTAGEILSSKWTPTNQEAYLAVLAIRRKYVPAMTDQGR